MISKSEIIKLIEEHPNYSIEKFFKKHFQEDYQNIQSIEFPDSFSFKQKIYHYLYDDLTFKLGCCPICGNRTKYRSFTYGYMKYCSVKCAENSEETRTKVHNTNMKLYGNSCSLNGKKIIEKKKKTWLEKYGVDNPAKSKLIQEKTQKTNLDKYGAKHPLQNNVIKEKVKQTNLDRYGVECTLQNNEIKEKSKQTCLEKYGVKYPSECIRVKEKVKQTNLDRYGVEYPMQNEAIKEKTKQTNLNKYGVECTLQNNEIKEKSKQTCLKKYGVPYSFQSDEIKEKIKQTNLSRYGIEWFCMSPMVKGRSYNSKPNLNFANLLDENNISYVREFPLKHYSYDFKIDSILVEINPIITHNSYLSIYGGEPKDKTYHLDKSNIAKNNNYQCIHIWDWDDMDKILNMLKPKKTLYARKLFLKEVSEKECNDFLNAYHLQNTCKGQSIRYGLYKDETLVQIMTFGKPRYNKNYELELLRLCSHKDYIIVGGTEKIFKYILDKFSPKSIISYCDNSKFNGNIYEKLGFKKLKPVVPSKHWYNIRTKQHITDNFLRQRGFDQIFETNYGKGTSNEELMLQYGFLPVYDCGQMTYIMVINFDDLKE